MKDNKIKTLLILVVILFSLIVAGIVLLFNINGRVYKTEEYIDKETGHSENEDQIPTLIPTLVNITPSIPATFPSATPIASSQTPEITQTLNEAIDTPVPSDKKYEPLTIDRELNVDDLAIVGIKYGMTEKEVRSIYGVPLYYSQWDRWECLDGGWYTYSVYEFGFVTYYNNTMGYKDVGIVESVKVMKTGSECPYGIKIGDSTEKVMSSFGIDIADIDLRADDTVPIYDADGENEVGSINISYSGDEIRTMEFSFDFDAGYGATMHIDMTFFDNKVDDYSFTANVMKG
ncbi:MAG: hypothetical protein JXN65_09195 [Clostridia bacterium]|nr:hypothetical protein [Clostridia bacterium]